MATVLGLVQAFCRIKALPVPSGIASSTDGGVLQIRELLNAVLEEIRGRADWQICSRTVNWTSVATASQGTITTLFPDAFERLVPGTFWDLALRKPVYGPVPDPGWQGLQAFQPGGPLYQFRVAGNQLLVNPTMAAGHSLSAIYKSMYTLLAADGTTYKQLITADDDSPVFSDRLVKLGLDFFWLRLKQMPFAVEEQRFEGALSDEASRDVIRPTVWMDGPVQTVTPGIWVPSGNWPV